MLLLKRSLPVLFSMMLGLILVSFLYPDELSNQWNVLLITVDSLRADHLGVYGYPRRITPSIDELARRGIVFSRASAHAPFTAPSLPTLFTSAYSNKHQVWAWGDSLNPSLFTLAQILSEEGFLTGVLSAQDFFPEVLGLSRGFRWMGVGIDKKADVITREAMEWLNEHKNKKFFLWIHYFDPHQPYQPPPLIKKEMTREIIPRTILPVIKKNPSDPDIFGAFGGISEKAIIDGRRDREYYISLYDGEIKFVDREVGRLIQFLEESKLLSRTFIIITADHGESLGEHNLYFTHGYTLYEENIHIPLIFYAPQELPPGKVVSQNVGLIDITPTILDFLRIKGKGREKMEGRSLLPLIYKGRYNTSRIIYGELREPKRGRHVVYVKEGNWKLIFNVWKGDGELYNLRNDPGETRDIKGEEKEVFSRLVKRAREYLSREKKSIPGGNKSRLKEEIRRRLKGLGYLSGE